MAPIASVRTDIIIQLQVETISLVSAQNAISTTTSLVRLKSRQFAYNAVKTRSRLKIIRIASVRKDLLLIITENVSVQLDNIIFRVMEGRREHV